MAQILQKRDGTFSDEAKQSTDSIKSIRFVVLGSDEVLMNEACDIIIGSTDKTTKHGTCEFKETCVRGRHVSVVKAPTYWLEHLKTYLSFSKGVRSMKRDMEFCYSLVFPGPHAFLLVLGDVRNSGKEHYLLHALSEVFGQEALDYSMVLFIHEYRDRDIGRNRCVRKCRKRFHVLKKNEDNVLKLFHDATETMIKQRKANFFTKDLDLLDKAETYFKREFDAKFEERESSLRADSAEMKTKFSELEKQNKEEVQDLCEELDAHRARENQLRKELDASRRREIQLSQQMDALKKTKNDLKEELSALGYRNNQLNEKLSASNERESQLISDNEGLQRKVEQLTANEKKLENNQEAKDKEAFLIPKIQECNIIQDEKELPAKAQEQYDRPRALDRREMELDDRERKPLQTVTLSTGSQHGHYTFTAVYSLCASELNEKRGEAEDISQVSESQQDDNFERVRRDGLDPPSMYAIL